MKIKLLAAAAVLAIATPGLAATNLLTNGGFETGTFAGWTQFGNTGFTGVAGAIAGVAPTEGGFQSYYGPVGSVGGISQSIATTAGASYTVTFDLHNFGGSPSAFSADFGGTNLLSQVDASGFTYTTLSYTVTATGASTALSFGFRQDPNYYLLDNVSVTANVPEPATWALMIGGFAMVGAVARRRRTGFATA